jgi:4-amino-4-deoxy-L-arabinose transferase-like glycosyltransferase
MRRAAWIGLVVVLLGAAAVRVRLLDLPLERDEGEYAYIATLLLDGVPPYAAAYSVKFPGTPLMYALWMAVFGRTVAAIRLGVVLTSSASAVLLFLLARRRLGSVSALAAVAAFTAISLAPALLATHAHAMHFVVLAAVGGLLALDRALDTSRLAPVFAAGTLFGLAVLMKQPGVVFAAFGLGCLVWSWWCTPARRSFELAARTVTFGAGFVTPLAATAAVLWATGTFQAFWFWTVSYAGHYATYASMPEGARRLGGRLGAMAPQLWATGLLVLAGLGTAIARPRHRYFAVLFLFSSLGVAAGMYFRPHYFIVLAPAAALLVAVAVEEAHRDAVTSTGRPLAAALVAAAVVFAVVQSLWMQRDLLFTATPTQVSRALYAASPFPEALEVGHYLKARTTPTDTIAVLGSEPEIFFYAGRRSATRHIYMYWLMEMHPFARAMQAELIAEIERARPAYLVYVRTDSSWHRSARSDRLIFDWIARFVPAHYERVGQVDILGPRETRYRWDADVAALDVTSSTHLVVLRRHE